MMTPSGASAALATDAARVFSNIDTRGIASISNAISGLDTKILGNASAMRDMAKALDIARPIVAPQIATELAETFKRIDTRNAAFAEAVKGIQLPAFQFAKTLDDLKLATRFPTGVAEAFKALQMPPLYSTGIREALAGLPLTGFAGVAAKAAFAVGEAAVIAETPAAVEVADDALVDLDDLSPTERRELQKDVADAIVALGTLVAILADNGRIELASATLAFLAILVSIYWRVTGSD